MQTAIRQAINFNYTPLSARGWSGLDTKSKLYAIELNGQGLNWRAMQESLDYLDALIDHLCDMAYRERLVRYSTKAAAEFCRYRSITSDNSRLFKVNNNLTADINHWLLRTFPEFDGFLRKNK